MDAPTITRGGVHARPMVELVDDCDCLDVAHEECTFLRAAHWPDPGPGQNVDDEAL